MLITIRVPSLELCGKKQANLVNLWRTTETDTNDKMKRKNNETINDDIDEWKMGWLFEIANVCRWSKIFFFKACMKENFV